MCSGSCRVDYPTRRSRKADRGGDDGEDPRQSNTHELRLRDRVQAVILAYETGFVLAG